MGYVLKEERLKIQTIHQGGEAEVYGQDAQIYP